MFGRMYVERLPKILTNAQLEVRVRNVESLLRYKNDMKHVGIIASELLIMFC